MQIGENESRFVKVYPSISTFTGEQEKISNFLFELRALTASMMVHMVPLLDANAVLLRSENIFKKCRTRMLMNTVAANSQNLVRKSQKTISKGHYKPFIKVKFSDV